MKEILFGKSADYSIVFYFWFLSHLMNLPMPAHQARCLPPDRSSGVVGGLPGLAGSLPRCRRLDGAPGRV
jgi:hypothetical protein